MINHQVIWDTPSEGPSGSMPLGNGDIGVNVWAEKDGDLLFYINKTDAWDENARLLKIGRIRISLTPNPFMAGKLFHQELHTVDGTVLISTGESPGDVKIRIWVDANRPVIRIEMDSVDPIEVKADLELWRNTQRPREGKEGHCATGLRTPAEREQVYPDGIIHNDDNAVIWCHHNRFSCWAATFEHQDMASYIPKGKDSLLHLTFGGLMRGDGFIRESDCALRSSKSRRHIVLGVHVLTKRSETLDLWKQAVKHLADANDSVALHKAFFEHSEWWERFWQRSWIDVCGSSEAETVSQGYALQRFINACGGRGAFPIKFNGSIFTVDADEPDEKYDADYRRWGGGYWFQNTRLIYWPMIMSGDFDLMEPWFKMYLDALDVAATRAKECFGIDNAAVFPETMTFWGAFLNGNYGFNRKGLEPGLSENPYIRRYWQGMLELLAILLDAYDVCRDEVLLREEILVLAPPFLRFYRKYHNKRDEAGKILFKPSQSLETWHQAVNPLPDIAGLRWVLQGLLKLSENDEIPDALRKEWTEFLGILPPIPTRSLNGGSGKELIPAVQYDDCKNTENAELYGIFPYRHFGIGKPEIETGLTTYQNRHFKEKGCWRQDGVQAAMLGLAEEAKQNVVHNFSNPHCGSRFPAFWGPHNDWIPDQDHGGAASIALQRMLLQWNDEKLFLLPAWPKDWDVDFKLHAPLKTTVTGIYRKGQWKKLETNPEHRKKDIIDMAKQGEYDGNH